MNMQGIGCIILGVIGGICFSIEGTLNSVLGKHVGVLKASLAPFSIGLIALLIIVFCLTGEKGGNIGDWMKAPWYSYLGGLFAVVFVAIIIKIIPKVGVAAALASIIVGQLVMSLVLDAMGLFALQRIPFSLPRIIGVILLLTGIPLIFTKPT